MEISRVGFGAWAIGGAGYEWGWGAQDDRRSLGQKKNLKSVRRNAAAGCGSQSAAGSKFQRFSAVARRICAAASEVTMAERCGMAMSFR